MTLTLRKNLATLLIVFLVHASCCYGQTGTYQAEGLPDILTARIEVRDRFLSQLPHTVAGFSPQFVIQTLKRWTPGSTVRVAFSGGDNALRKRIVDASSTWLTYGNIKLDFGYNQTTGSYRNWQPSDTMYVAEIRISFNQAGYWSLVGRDSVDPAIVFSGEASMNFGGFTVSLPQDWQTIVAHEFGHAFGFEHEHQSPVGGCNSQFRWFDDPLYEPTRDQYGQFIIDSLGRRPGVYTVLGGPPNYWPSAKVDFNLRQLSSSSSFSVGPFDPMSIMMYSFPVWMFVSPASPCHTTENLVLSMQDQRGFTQAYPFSPADMSRISLQRRDFLIGIVGADVPLQTRERFRTMLGNAQ